MDIQKNFNKKFFVTLFLVSFIVTVYSIGPANNQKKKEAIKEQLTEKARFFAPKIDERKDWEKILKYNEINKIIKEAENFLTKDIPVLTEDLYLDYSQTGNRTKWEKVATQRLSILKSLVIAEATENNGRFIKKIEEFLMDYCTFKTWVRPAHDKNLDNYYGRIVDIDLESAELSLVLSATLYILDKNIDIAVQKKVKENIEKRVLLPFKRMVLGSEKENWWLRGTNNWNAVCLNGVVSSALTLIDSKEERSFFIESAINYSKYYLQGFSLDGYCTEGVGYWNYGFSNFVMLSEMIMLNSNGKISLYNDDIIKKIIDYGFNIEITEGVAPSFADCSINDVPDRRLLYFLSKKFDLPVADFGQKIKITDRLLSYALFYLFQDIFDNKNIGKTVKKERTFFDKHGVIILRNPKEKSLNIAIKAGHNDEHHNHNDVGSYVLTLGNTVIIADPGAEVYTARTFSDKRYESKVINSYGHPVPVVAGSLQKAGKDAKGKIISTDFSENLDKVTIDLKDAYPFSWIEKLTREVVFSREEKGKITITDSTEFKSPKKFETALITMGGFIKQSDKTFLIYNQDKILLCEIDAGENNFSVTTEKIEEDLRAKDLPTRLGIKLDKSVNNAFIKIVFTPFEIKNENFLTNGDFELKSFGWEIPKDGMSTIDEKTFYSGKYSLKVEDNDEKKGSNVSSVKIELPIGDYQLKGKVFILTGKGLGIYLRFFDKEGNLLNQKDEKGNITAQLTLDKDSSSWKDFSVDFKIVPECKFTTLWIHSFNASLITAFLDELKIIKR